MSYIEEVEPGRADGLLKKTYDKMTATRNARPSAVMSVMSLNPPAMEAVFDLTYVVAHGGSTLGRRREEMLATMISRLNHCQY